MRTSGLLPVGGEAILRKEGKETLQMTPPELYDMAILAGCAEVEHHEIAV